MKLRAFRVTEQEAQQSYGAQYAMAPPSCPYPFYA